MYDPIGALAHQLPTYYLRSWADTNGNSRVCCERWYTWPSSRNLNGHHPESLSENLSTACSITVYSCALHNYMSHAITSCTHFGYIFVIMSLINKQLRLILWHNTSLTYPQNVHFLYLKVPSHFESDWLGNVSNFVCQSRYLLNNISSPLAPCNRIGSRKNRW